MSFQLSTNAESEVIRHTAKFQPSIWGDLFTAYNPDDEITRSQRQHMIDELKEVVRKELMATVSQPWQQLKFIDAIQRLGVGYHFEKEINKALQHIHANTHDLGCDIIEEDLYSVSLWFRLLRQQGISISSDIFNKFKNGGEFKESLVDDVHGMLSLYEATHLGMHREEVLDEALSFTSIHLKAFATTNARNPLSSQVIRALERPIRKCLPRLEARYYISIYEEEDFQNKALLKLAKLDFNLVQSLHKKELSLITMWWKELDLAAKLPYGRDRVVELYVWVMTVYFEPQYSLGRIILTKIAIVLTILDDTYDAYGTIEELEPFTQAIERWDIKSIDQLPDYMKLCYRTLLNLYKEIEDEMQKEGRTYRVQYAIKSMKRVVGCYFVEAKWFKEQYVPTMEEYMKTAMYTAANSLLTTSSFIGMGEVITMEAFDWVANDPLIIRASSIIGRLMDDITTHKFEQERGHVASSIECYMKQYGVSEEEVYDEFRKQVVNAWKDINQEWLKPMNDIPMYLLTRVLNLTRVIDTLYKDYDALTHGGEVMKDVVTSLLLNRVPI